MNEIFDWINSSAGASSWVLVMVPAVIILLWVWTDIKTSSDMGKNPEPHLRK